ncbi:hypothetical protein TNCV_4559501 [Trichonephila clavipes]|nr:hypothetical protein TNCV_4559501 [Trichonephila clavipes]
MMSASDVPPNFESRSINENDTRTGILSPNYHTPATGGLSASRYSVRLPLYTHVCSHTQVPRAHQAGLSRRSLAGVGLSESVRCHGPGLALLTNWVVQQKQHTRKVFSGINYRAKT